jgi:hypothetical protein
MPVDVRPLAPSARVTSRLPHALAVIGAVAVAAAAAGVSRPPAFVDRIELVNRSPYELSVDVRGAAARGWVPLGYVDQEATTPVHEVLDQGGRWTFRFSAQGQSGGQLTVSRADLEAGDWRLDIPDAVGERLRGSGAPPSP